MDYLSESRNSVMGDLVASQSNFDMNDLGGTSFSDAALGNKSFHTVLSATSLTGGNASSSSKAVLAALRALQDKIRRLESERSQALDEVTQLRLQLKNQEIESEHQKQREQLTMQKSMQDAKVSQERLQQEKMELEVRVQRMEDKIRLSQQSSEDLQTKIRVLEDEKHSANLKIREMEHSHHQMEQQIKSAQIKEKDMAQTLIWETKHHEEEVSLLNNRVSSLQEELTRVSHEKGNMDGRIVELDQLVGQLLALNESLVAQLSGKPWKALTPSAGTKKIKKVKKSSSVSSVPRVASLATEASKAAAKKVTMAAHHKGIDGSDIDQLRSLHKAYAKMASSLTRAVSPLATRSPHRSRKSSVADGAAASETHYSTASLGTSRGSTRLSRKKKSSSSSSSSGDHVSSAHNSRPSTPLSSSAATAPSMTTTASVRIPKPAVSFDASQLGGDLHHYHLQDSSDDHPNRSYLSAQQIDVSQLRSPALNNNNNNHNNNNNQSYNTFPTRSSGTNPFTGSRASSSSEFQPKEDLKEMISSLEEEFNDLNRQYRRLLSNVSASSTEVPASLSEQSIDDRAQEIVKVIQKLHEKGEQLRVLKSPTK